MVVQVQKFLAQSWTTNNFKVSNLYDMERKIMKETGAKTDVRNV